MRARTRPGRLRALDAWLCVERREALRPGGMVLDVGFGVEPVTTLELAAAVRAVEPSLRVTGVERDAGRARAPSPPDVTLVCGDFDALPALGPACVIRVMNVLRGCRAAELPGAWVALAGASAEGGVVLEGSSDTEGHVTTAWVLSRVGGALRREALLLHTDFTRGFSPWLFRDWLPRDVRRSLGVGHPVRVVLEAWAARVEALGPGLTPVERFSRGLDAVSGLEATAWERAGGYVRWRCPEDFASPA